jgi:hypothetical protein
MARLREDHSSDRLHRIAEADLVTVVLDVSTSADIQLRIDKVSNPQRKLHKALRMCHQAYKQGGLLNNFDLSEILNVSDYWISHLYDALILSENAEFV